MNYALIENGLVVNIIWLDERNAAEFPGAVKLDDRAVCIGDGYADGVFTRDGVPVLTPLEEAQETIAELDLAFLDAEYGNIIGGLE